MTNVRINKVTAQLTRREADAVTFDQMLIGGSGLPIDTDQVVAWRTLPDLLLEQYLDGDALGHVHVVGEAAAVVVDDQNSHRDSFR